MMEQRQKKGDPGDEPDRKQSTIQDDKSLSDAAAKGKDILSKLDGALKKKGGHFEICCGIRRWVPD